MATKKNKNKQSGQLARQSQNNNNNNAPVARAISARSTAPKISNTPKMTRVIHRELVQTISGSTTFNADSFSLNPGLPGTFPWLSSIAGSFEQYRFNRLSFHYVTRAPTSYIGSILLAPEYDALDSPPSSEVEASQMLGAVEDSPWKEQIMTFNVSDMFPMGPRKYIRTGVISGSSDLKTYDAGQLFVCEISCADTSAIGKLWVEYDVELHIPQNPNTATANNLGSASSYSLITSAQSLSTGVAATVAWNNEEYDGLNLTNSSGVFSVPVGTYQVSGVVQLDSGGAYTAVVDFTPLQGGVAIANYTSSCNFASAASYRYPFNFTFTASTADTIAIQVELTTSGTLTIPVKTSSIVIKRI
jgi:hypothetical protein